jgi:quercetin dioxygenase-like cupin family protein
MSVQLVSRHQLPSGAFSHEFVGADHGGVGVSLILTEAEPGQGPSLHRHPYEEIHVVQDGEALFVAGDEERVARAGDIVVVPAGTPHRYEAGGDGAFREMAIHVSPRFVTEWLDG